MKSEILSVASRLKSIESDLNNGNIAKARKRIKSLNLKCGYCESVIEEGLIALNRAEEVCDISSENSECKELLEEGKRRVSFLVEVYERVGKE